MMDRRSFASRVLAVGAGLIGSKAGKVESRDHISTSSWQWEPGRIVAWDWQADSEMVEASCFVDKNGLRVVLEGRPITEPRYGRAFDLETGEEVEHVWYYDRLQPCVKRYATDESGCFIFKAGYKELEVITETRRLRLEFADGRVVE